MEEARYPLARHAAGGIALLALAALAAQLAINTPRDGSLPLAALNLLRFFTIWTNCAVAVMLGLVAMGRQVRESLLLALASAIAMVALVYHLLLAAQFHPEGWEWWTDQAFHSLVPALTLVWWLSFTPVEERAWRGLPWVVVPPIAYSLVVLAAAQWTRFYPYFFLDAAELGWPRVLANMVGLGIAFLAMGALLIVLRRAARRLS